jgi:invasion protein IalB
MKITSKQLYFIVAGLAAITIMFTLMTHFNVATAAKENGKVFEDWIVSCARHEKKDKQGEFNEICVLTQQLNITPENSKEKQPIALFQIGYFGDKKELKMVQTLPLGISIQAGTSIVSDQKMIAAGVYTTCLNTGCNAVANISDQDLKTLLSGKDNTLAFMSVEGKQISLPLSTKGLDQGLKYIK